MKISLGKIGIVGCATVAAATVGVEAAAFAPGGPVTLKSSPSASSTSLDFFKGGTGASKESLDEQWEAQQELLKLRRAPEEDRDKYFQKVDERRADATQEQIDKWAWQRKQYKKGEDPIDEWRKRRESGQISDLDNQYGDPKKVGGIPLPMASFGVGGEFGVGGKFDNGGRFDLRLPYADQGYVDEDAEPFSFGNFFGGGKKKKEEAKETEPEVKEEPPKQGFWPF